MIICILCGFPNYWNAHRNHGPHRQWGTAGTPEDTNFHWIRMDSAGNWSHKPGGTPVRNTEPGQPGPVASTYPLKNWPIAMEITI